MNFTKQQRKRLVDHYDPTSLINKLIEDCDELEKELMASRESKSAVPSEEVAKLYDQFDTMRGMFIDSNVGSYSFIQAMVHLGKAMKYFKEFEERLGIA